MEYKMIRRINIVFLYVVVLFPKAHGMSNKYVLLRGGTIHESERLSIYRHTTDVDSQRIKTQHEFKQPDSHEQPKMNQELYYRSLGVIPRTLKRSKKSDKKSDKIHEYTSDRHDNVFDHSNEYKLSSKNSKKYAKRDYKEHTTIPIERTVSTYKPITTPTLTTTPSLSFHDAQSAKSPTLAPVRQPTRQRNYVSPPTRSALPEEYGKDDDINNNLSDCDEIDDQRINNGIYGNNKLHDFPISSESVENNDNIGALIVSDDKENEGGSDQEIIEDEETIKDPASNKEGTDQKTIEDEEIIEDPASNEEGFDQETVEDEEIIEDPASNEEDIDQETTENEEIIEDSTSNEEDTNQENIENERIIEDPASNEEGTDNETKENEKNIKDPASNEEGTDQATIEDGGNGKSSLDSKEGGSKETWIYVLMGVIPSCVLFTALTTFLCYRSSNSNAYSFAGGKNGAVNLEKIDNTIPLDHTGGYSGYSRMNSTKSFHDIEENASPLPRPLPRPSEPSSDFQFMSRDDEQSTEMFDRSPTRLDSNSDQQSFGSRSIYESEGEGPLGNIENYTDDDNDTDDDIYAYDYDDYGDYKIDDIDEEIDDLDLDESSSLSYDEEEEEEYLPTIEEENNLLDTW